MPPLSHKTGATISRQRNERCGASVFSKYAFPNPPRFLRTRVMRISRLALGIALLALPATFAIAGSMSFNSAQEALKQGVSAYDSGDYEIAIPALEYAADQDEFVAEY